MHEEIEADDASSANAAELKLQEFEIFNVKFISSQNRRLALSTIGYGGRSMIRIPKNQLSLSVTSAKLRYKNIFASVSFGLFSLQSMTSKDVADDFCNVCLNFMEQPRVTVNGMSKVLKTPEVIVLNNT